MSLKQCGQDTIKFSKEYSQFVVFFLFCQNELRKSFHMTIAAWNSKQTHLQPERIVWKFDVFGHCVCLYLQNNLIQK